MRNVEHDAGRGHAQRIEDRVERVDAEIVDPLKVAGAASELRWSVQCGKQAVEQRAVGTIRLEHRVRNTCIGSWL